MIKKKSPMSCPGKKYVPIILLALLVAASSHAQLNFNDSLAESRNCITRSAMITLGSWATANIISGFIVAGRTQGEVKYAWRMNAYWNFVNLGLAGMGYLNAVKGAAKKYSFADNVEEQQKLEKIYVFNFGLDLAYIASGLYLRERARNETSPSSSAQLSGYGSSIILQGGFLLLMDGVMIKLHQKNSLLMNKRLRRFDLAIVPAQISLHYRF